MATHSSAIGTTSQRVEHLNQLESDIANVLVFASESLQELSKDSPAREVVEHKSTQLFVTLHGIEKGLKEQITYLGQVSTSSPHQQSIYGVQKDLCITLEKEAYLRDRIEQAKSMTND